MSGPAKLAAVDDLTSFVHELALAQRRSFNAVSLEAPTRIVDLPTRARSEAAGS